jgi:hypothetical protein
MGTAAIGKWLLSGFEENKRRVAFEAALVAGGYTQAEAESYWDASDGGRKRLTGVKAPQNRNNES